MNPSVAARNLTPTSMAALSVSSFVVGVAVDGQIVHGQEEGGGLATVVNDQLTGAIVLPAASLAPVTATLYWVLVANAADGVNVAVRLASLYTTVAATADPPTGVNDICTVPACNDSLNVAATTDPTATSTAPTTGDRDVTSGADVSPATVVNDQLTGAIVLPAASLAPVTATLYWVLVANAADGVNVAVRLASLYTTVAATADPPTGVNDICAVPACNDSLNVAATTDPTATSTAPTTGDRDVTSGAEVSNAGAGSEHDVDPVVLRLVVLVGKLLGAAT